MLIGKVIFLLLAVCYSVPVVFGFARGATIGAAQTMLWGIGIVGFITLQWLV
jgi:hypothetical protein